MDNRDHDMMHNPSNWPRWPHLPIKNNRDREPGEFPRLGVLVDFASFDEMPDPHFVEGSIYQITPDEIKAAPAADLDQLLADGWVVD